MTALNEEVLTFLEEDLAPPCGHREHDKYGFGPAVWVVYAIRYPCGHTPLRVNLLCDQCWTRFMQIGVVHCRECHANHPLFSVVDRVERI